jgi:tetratricopeptide (TPR) repeat protein
MALLAAHARFATERYWMNPGHLGKILLTAAVAAAIGYLSAQGFRKGAATYWLDQAAAAKSEPRRAAAFIVKAQEADPANWELAYKLGDYLYRLGLEHGPDSIDWEKRAFAWYGRAMCLNRFDAYAPVGCGMCLDRMGLIRQATPYFELAHRNDPNNTYIALEEGRHCIELGDFAAARQWLNDAMRVAATEVAWEEAQKLQRMMADPLFAAPK